jgi:hypothetical protein
MRKKLLLVAALIAGVASGAAAQEPIKFGVRAGLNFDNQTESRGGSSSTSLGSKAGFHLGGIADIPLASFAASLPEWLYVQPGLYLTTKGAKDSQSSSGYSAEYTRSLYYLEVPIRALAKFPITDDIKVGVNFGPAIGVALSGKDKQEMTSGGVTTPSSGNTFKKGNNMGRFHFGLDFGAGVYYRQFYLGLNYDLGLSNMYTGSGNYSLKNRTFSISIGYSF